MGRFYGLPGLALGLAVCAAISFYWEGRASAPPEKPLLAIAQAKASFLKNRPPIVIDIAALPQNRYPELIQPKASLPQSHLHSVSAVASLYRYAEDCGDVPRKETIPAELKKTWTWHRFVCRDLKLLPKKFFETAPFLHPSGSSFVRLAELTGRPEFRDGPWRDAHSAYLHVTEIESNLSREMLQNILEDSPFFLQKGYVFFRRIGETKFDAGAKYLAYPLALWSHHLEKTPLRTVPWKTDEWCLVKEGNICWKKREALPFASRRLSLLFLLTSLALLAATLLGLIVQKLRLRAKEREARLFALQMLTHELRTPATTLGLGVESLKRHFDALPPPAQSNVLRMSDEIQRLNRVLQASTRYLQSHSDPRRVRFDLVEVESANGFFERILEPYQGTLTFVALNEDAAIQIDRYWVGLCVKNLVDNALTHGMPPVSVRLSRPKKGLLVEVSDAGSVTKYDLHDLKGGLSRSESSSGLGIGLSLVARIATLMKGKLTLQTSPTTFSLWIRSPA